MMVGTNSGAGLCAADRTLSVVVPSFNRAGSLSTTLGSLLDQTYPDFEVIVVDDGSEDETQSVVAAWPDPRVRYVRQERSGRSAARNRGAALARGRHLVFLDSDDVVAARWVECFASALESAPVACCGATIRFERRRAGRRREIVRLPRHLGPVYHDYRGLFLAGTFALEREIFLELEGYDRRLAFSENTDLALRLVELCKQRGLEIAAIEEPMLIFEKRRPAPSVHAARELFDAARLILEKHGSRYLHHQPASFANYHAIAGVNAARLGALGSARSHFFSASRAAPWIGKHWLRLVCSLVPGLPLMLWRTTPSHQERICQG